MKRMTKGAEPDIKKLVEEYNTQNNLKNEATKKTKELGDEIKAYFKKHDIESYEGDTCVAKTSVTTKNSFDEEQLLTILKENGGKKAIKKIEVVDHEALEGLMYHGKINPAILAPAQRSVSQVSLRMTAKKEKKDE